jgi:hypothetical protein
LGLIRGSTTVKLLWFDFFGSGDQWLISFAAKSAMRFVLYKPDAFNTDFVFRTE